MKSELSKTFERISEQNEVKKETKINNSSLDNKEFTIFGTQANQDQIMKELDVLDTAGISSKGN